MREMNNWSHGEPERSQFHLRSKRIKRPQFLRKQVKLVVSDELNSKILLYQFKENETYVLRLEPV